jgi:pheromone a factor receptor
MLFLGLAYRLLRKHATQLQEFVSSDGKNQNRYVRLLAMTATVLTVTVILQVVSIAITASLPLLPWISWDDTHFHFSDIVSFVRQDPILQAWTPLETFRWTYVLSAFLFFAFFGFAAEARLRYQKVYSTISSFVGLPSLPTRPNAFGSGKLYSTDRFATSKTNTIGATTLDGINLGRHKRATFDSFIDALSVISVDESEVTHNGARASTPDLTRPHPARLSHANELRPQQPVTTVAGFPPGLSAPRHTADAPSSPRPYSAWSDTV